MDAVEAFYADYLNAIGVDGYLFGLITAKIDASTDKWRSTHARAWPAEDIRGKISDAVDQGRDVHLSVSLVPEYLVQSSGEYSRKNITFDNALSRAFCFDFDIANPEKKKKPTDYTDLDELRQALDAAHADGLPAPDYVVSSGRGLHYWYFISNYLPAKSHNELRQAWLGKIINYGLTLDNAAGSTLFTLRAPGTINRKKAHGPDGAFARAEKLTARIRTARALQKAFGTEITLRSAQADAVEQARKDERTYEPFGIYTTALVKKACPFVFAQCVTGSADADYQQWLGVGSIVRHIEGWPSVWAKRCKAHYAPAPTDEAIETALDPERGLHGPVTCAAIGGGVMSGSEYCQDCRAHTIGSGAGHPMVWIDHLHRQEKVQGPVKAPPAPSEESETPEQELSAHGYPELEKFRVAPGKRDGVFDIYSLVRKRGSVQLKDVIASPAFKLLQVEKRDSGDRMIGEERGREFNLPFAAINNATALGKELGEIGVMVHDLDAARHYVMAVMHEGVPQVRVASYCGWTLKRRREAGPLMRQFTTPQRVLKPKRIEAESSLDNPPNDGRAVGQAGHLAGWRDALQPILDNNAEVYAFAVMLGFAAILPAIVDKSPLRPALVSFYHPDSGKGKSTALLLANSVFMKPVEFNIGFDDTPASMFQSFGVLNHLFIAIDEFTSKVSLVDFDMLGFVNGIFNGAERGRLNPHAQQRERASFNTILGLSTNESVNNFLSGRSQQGGLARVHEIYMDTMPLPEFEAKQMLKNLDANHGVAGVEFAHRLMALDNAKERITDALMRWQKTLSTETHQTGQEHRFAINLFSYVLCAMELTNEFELTNFSTASQYAWAKQEVLKRATSLATVRYRTEIRPEDFIEEMRADIRNTSGARIYPSDTYHKDTGVRVVYSQGKLFINKAAWDYWVARKPQRRSMLSTWASSGYIGEAMIERAFRYNGIESNVDRWFVMELTAFLSAEDVAKFNNAEQLAGVNYDS